MRGCYGSWVIRGKGSECKSCDKSTECKRQALVNFNAASSSISVASRNSIAANLGVSFQDASDQSEVIQANSLLEIFDSNPDLIDDNIVSDEICDYPNGEIIYAVYTVICNCSVGDLDALRGILRDVGIDVDEQSAQVILRVLMFKNLIQKSNEGYEIHDN